MQHLAAVGLTGFSAWCHSRLARATHAVCRGAVACCSIRPCNSPNATGPAGSTPPKASALTIDRVARDLVAIVARFGLEDGGYVLVTSPLHANALFASYGEPGPAHSIFYW